MLENNNKFENMVQRFEKLSSKVENNMKKNGRIGVIE